VKQHIGPEQFRELVKRYSPYVYSLAYRILGNMADAQDVSQETFVKIYRSYDQYDTKRDIKNWICTIAVNASRDFYRKTRRAYEYAFDEEKAPGIEERLDDRIDLKRVMSALDIRYRTVVVLFYLERKSIEEIAGIIKRPKGVVKIWLFRARKSMLDLYAGKKKNEMFESTTSV